MATPVILPRQGQSVESCLIAGWKKQPGESVEAGEIICEVETDKALVEIESPASGTVLAHFFAVGDDVPVMTNIAAIGEPGEAVEGFRPDAGGGAKEQVSKETEEQRSGGPKQTATPSTVIEKTTSPGLNGGVQAISPRARHLAERQNLDITQLAGSGPEGRIIERDVQAALAAQPKMTPLAKSMVTQGGFSAPARGSGVSGRVMAGDLTTASKPGVSATPAEPVTDDVEIIPVKGIRQVIAQRMLESLQTTAQLTLNASADARTLLAYRQRLKNSNLALGLNGVTINDLILFSVSRLLLQHSDLNALFADNAIARHKNVHLGFAVDTPRGLMVPVIRRANTLSLKQISEETKRLATACLENKIKPDELSGGTFTVTNLGSFGIESFTPVLNPPQVAILGVSNINLKPVEVDGQVEFISHLGLSLTINHQVVDGAPGARFLQGVAQGLAEIELLLAV